MEIPASWIIFYSISQKYVPIELLFIVNQIPPDLPLRKGGEQLPPSCPPEVWRVKKGGLRGILKERNYEERYSPISVQV